MLKNSSEILDQPARTRALDPSGSFIVQAPAGSGKTQLLITRILILLLYVERPEEILALTFTRKAAAEMKRRIIETLQKFENMPIREEIPHKLGTSIEEIAQAVLHKDSIENWNILKNPSRLRIMTLDAFCAKLIRQLPVHSELLDIPNITENPHSYYVSAIDALLEEIEQDSPLSDAVQSLLEHYDHSWHKVKNFLIHLLQTREQWLSYLTQVSTDNFSEVLEHNLETIINDHLKAVFLSLDVELKVEWYSLLQFSLQQLQYTQNVAENLNHSESEYDISSSLEKFPEPDARFLKLWKKLIHCVLTQDGTLRRQVDKRLGFPAASSGCNPSEKDLFKHMKIRMQTLLEQLSKIHGCEECLQKIMVLPEVTLSEFQNIALSNLLILLPALNKKLKEIFFEHSVADFTTVQLSAVQSLGTTDDPSELLLALDERINHILIDEFQDTSNIQYQLLQTLTSGWQYNDGRTLFLVGDPQQSIYGFRAAEVGLFLKAQRYGIGEVKLTPLFLKMNFRSTPTLIAWYNKTFSHLFPKYDDEVSGAVRFTDAHAASQHENFISQTNIHVYDKKVARQQCAYIQDIIKFIQQKNELHPQPSIAILVRNRKHALPILDALRTSKIACNATGIIRLAESPAILDLLALMQALLSLSDRIAWLAVLRAPWCGLTLTDLLIFGENKQVCILEMLQCKEIVARLSNDAQQRIDFCLPIFLRFIKKIGHQPLSELIEEIWIALLGPATVKDADQFFEIYTFFQLVSKFCQKENILFHYQDFFEFFKNENFNDFDSQANPVQVMTIHKAKGLEFDHVILLGLEQAQQHDPDSLLLWHEFVSPSMRETCLFLLAPLYSNNTYDKNLYQFIRQQKKQKQEYEELRLFYVAATRARCQLHIFMQLHFDEGKSLQPYHSALLKKLWPLIHDSIAQQDISPPIDTEKNPMLQEPLCNATHYNLTRLVAYPKQLEFDSMPISEHVAFDEENQSTLLSATLDLMSKNEGYIGKNFNIETITGNIIHAMLCDISTVGLDCYLKHHATHHHWLIQLRELGATSAQTPIIIQNLEKTVTILKADPQAAWLLNPIHRHAQSEWKLYYTEPHESKLFIIDRTFITDDIRWIIDYKTDKFLIQDESLFDFLNRKKKEHSMQLNNYAKLIAAFDQEFLQEVHPIKLGLYFPCIPAWIAWEAEA